MTPSVNIVNFFFILFFSHEQYFYMVKAFPNVKTFHTQMFVIEKFSHTLISGVWMLSSVV